MRASARAIRSGVYRVAEVHDFVTRAISGHATTTMHQHDSTVSGEEVRSGLAKVVDLLGFAQRARGGGKW